jgi:hypothetical protein
MELKGRTVLLTGASSGIGRRLAWHLAGAGANLAIAARREQLLEELAEELVAAGHRRPVVLPSDLSGRGAAARLAEDTAAAIGPIDILVNNAGGGVGGSQWAVGDGDEAREAFEINFWSPVALVAAVVPSMRARATGAVVNVTSGAPYAMTWPTFGHYAATKAALSMVSAVLQVELAGSGVHVLEAIPGPVDTAVQGETRLIPGISRFLDRGGLGDADVMARLIVEGLRNNRSRVAYPRRTWVAYAMPALARRYASRVATREFAGLDDATREALFSLHVRTGSMGDPVAQAARKEWEERPVG